MSKELNCPFCNVPVDTSNGYAECPKCDLNIPVETFNNRPTEIALREKIAELMEDTSKQANEHIDGKCSKNIATCWFCYADKVLKENKNGN